MDFQAFTEALKQKLPKKFTARQVRLEALRRARKGKLYVERRWDFSQEYENGDAGPRLLLDSRRPSVQYTLPAMIVRDTVSMLLGEEHRPLPLVRDDDNTNDWILAFIEDTRVWWHLTNAATMGADGSVAWVTRVLPANGEGKPGRFFHEVWPGVECLPVFKRNAPDQLESITRTYFASADSLKADGYDVDALTKKWDSDGRTRMGKARAQAMAQGTIDEWVLRCKLDAIGETWYEPVPRFVYENDEFEQSGGIPWPVDEERSTKDHKLKEVPAVWITNGPTDYELYPDGPCTFEPAINFQFRIDRTLSQSGRAFDYTGDPQFARSRGTGAGPGAFGESEEEMGGTSADVIEVDEKGGAWFVEIAGEGLKTAIEIYVKLLREIAREVAGGNRVDPDASQVGKMSGVAMKMLNAALIWTTSLGRQAYGELGLIPVLKLGMRISEIVNVELPTLKARIERRQADAQKRAQVQKQTAAASDVLKDPTLDTGCGGGCGCCDDCKDGCDGTCCDKCGTGPDAERFDGKPDADAYIEISWPAYYEPDGTELQGQVTAITTAVEGGVISKETGVANAAPLFDVRDSEKELDRINDEQALNRARTASDAKLQAENEPKGASPPSKG